MADHWVTINGRHVLVSDNGGGGHTGKHNPITHTGNKVTDKAIHKTKKDLIASHQSWMESRGGTVEGYVKKFGENGRKYFKSDQNALRDLYRLQR